ncbi:lipid-binding SYLF domain-containing protein [Sneathiella marina]|uniref:Lipid-binding SYLF domain-containing protein n=1 Tax=Sneathiella marina TaxID=2950108 RepID=A0ABY4W2T0_9PROT|nr:lipid-binding SYLF domain-containing protein [Sneathiella marina]USG61368.1 lipid-binding SYLF domain-containing protein [Sneathiella marina]
MRETINLVRRSFISLMAAGLLFAGTSSLATAGDNQDQLVERAKFTIENLAKNPDMGEFRKLLAVAKGVVVFPQILEAGFFIGGAGGSGVLLAQDGEGNWTSPAFYSMGQGSIGLQFGAQAKELVLVVMTEKGLKAIINNNVKLGADLSAAVGPVGTQVGAATTTNLNSDVFSFANAKGLFIGASVAGSVLSTKQEWNELYYGKAVSPTAVVIDRSVNNPQSDGLRAALKAAEAP